MFLRTIAAAIAIAVAIGNPDAALARDQVIQVPSDDQEMVDAIAKARASLPDFWAKFRAKPADIESFAVKVRIPYGNDRGEHFWLTDVRSDGTQHSGIISNDPNNATHVTKGQRYRFTDPDISDWLYRRNGKMVGNETMRPLLKRMPAEKAEQYRAMYETP